MRRRELIRLADTIPDEYQRVLYITAKSYGTAGSYVNTGYTPNQDTRVVAMMQRTSESSLPAYYGTESPRFTLLKTRADYNTMEKASFPSPIPLNFICRVDHNKNVINVGEFYTQTIAPYANFTCSKPLYIFALNGYTKAETQFKGRLYYFKIYENDALQRSFVPCYRKEDGAIGLYDRVTQAFFEATGDFEYGNVA